MRWLVSEVVQTSAMDCGPAALMALLDGFGINVNFESLRERCQTEVDGTSIDDLEIIAKRLGLDAEQTMLPIDYLDAQEGVMPAILVARQPSGLLHFVVLWNAVGPFIQVMDPSVGRRWIKKKDLLQTVFPHAENIPASKWRGWAGAEGAVFMRSKMSAIGIDATSQQRLLDVAGSIRGWLGFGALDAAIRMTTSLVPSGVAKGEEAARFIRGLLERTLSGGTNPTTWIADKFWSVTPGESTHEVLLRGAVLVRIRGARHATMRAVEEKLPSFGPHRTPQRDRDEASRPNLGTSGARAAQMVQGLDHEKPKPRELLYRLMTLDGKRSLAMLGAAIAASAVIAIVDALALRGVFEATRTLGAPVQRIGALAALVLFVGLSFALELPVTSALQRIGRGLECRVRAQLLEKLPRLEDRYVRGRPTSDFAARAHAIHSIKNLPELLAQTAKSALGIAITAGAIIWLHPQSAVFALLAMVAAVGIPLLLHRPVSERALRLQTHGGALSRFYLDALHGLAPIKAHGAERAVAREHEGLLVEWAKTGRALHTTMSWTRGLQSFFTMALAVGLVVHYVATGGPERTLLLVVYWALRLAASGQELATSLGAYPQIKSVAARLFEPLNAPDAMTSEAGRLSKNPTGRGVHLELRGVTARVMGHTVLHRVNTMIGPGEHVAIVGSSGAGKSTLLSLLLGWVDASEGEVLVDGIRLDSSTQAALHARTAWVDPSVHLFDRSLLENVTYSAPNEVRDLPLALEASDLENVLDRLSNGLQTPLGEGGSNVSGGQGQRVRFARAVVRRSADLVLLDEAFRGLERNRRQAMLARARRLWEKSTLLCVTHDVADVQHFDRVIVIDDGNIVEDGAPADLLRRKHSKYRELCEAELEAKKKIWGAPHWRRVQVGGGRVVSTTGLEGER